MNVKQTFKEKKWDEKHVLRERKNIKSIKINKNGRLHWTHNKKQYKIVSFFVALMRKKWVKGQRGKSCIIESVKKRHYATFIITPMISALSPISNGCARKKENA